MTCTNGIRKRCLQSVVLEESELEDVEDDEDVVVEEEEEEEEDC